MAYDLSGEYPDYAPENTGTQPNTATQPRSTTNPWDVDLQAAYKKYLGRNADPRELAVHYNNPGGKRGIIQTIMGSPEAYDYANRPVETPNATTTTTPPTTPASPATPKGYAHIQGFDYGKLSDPNHVGPGKYDKGVKLFSQALYALNNPDAASTDLQQVVDWMNANGGNGAYSKTSDDRINGVDVKIDSGKGGWWYNNFPEGDPNAPKGPTGGNRPPIGPPSGINHFLPSPTIGYGPSQTTPNAFWEGRSPMQFGQIGQLVPQSPLADQNTALLQQLMQRIRL